MSVSMVDNLDIRKRAPNVARDLFTTFEEMKNYDLNYLGDMHISSCLEDGKIYVYNVKNTVDATTGKWRRLDTLINTGGSVGEGSVVTNSTTNGNIQVDGNELTVYDDSEVRQSVEDMNTDVENILTALGELDDLTTTEKTNFVDVINEVMSNIPDTSEVTSQIGTLENLATEDKSSVVNAINEVASKGGGEGISGYPVSVENPKHNGLLYFDIRKGENGEFVISNSALPSSAEEFSYVGNTTLNSGSKTLTGTTQNGNLINQRYLSATISWTLQTLNSDDEWVTSSSSATKSLNSDGSVSFSGNDFKWVNGNNSGSYSSYFNSISVDANGNVTISLTMRGKQWRSLNLTVSGVY